MVEIYLEKDGVLECKFPVCPTGHRHCLCFLGGLWVLSFSSPGDCSVFHNVYFDGDHVVMVIEIERLLPLR